MKYRAAMIGIAMLLSLQAAVPGWAAETQQETAASQIETAETTELPENGLTFAEALKKAINNSSALRSAEDMEEYLDELEEDLDDRGYSTVPKVSYRKWVDDKLHSMYSSLQSIESSQANNRYSEEITKISLEATVKSYFTSILSDESALKLAEKNVEIQKTIYEQGQAKYRYGMISEYELNTLENNYTTAKESVTSLEKTLSEEYRSLNYLMGEKEDTKYTLIYDTEYEPYTMNQTLEQYINTRLKEDYTILQKEQSVEDAYFSSNYLSYSSTKADSLKKKLDYEEAKRNLKTAKQDKEQAIKTAYDSIQKLEDSYVSAKNSLKTAQSDLILAQLNYEIGKITELALKQAEMAVEQAEENLQQIVYAHDLQIYQFENTELL